MKKFHRINYAYKENHSYILKLYVLEIESLKILNPYPVHKQHVMF